MFRKTRAFIKRTNLTKKINKNLCKGCKKKAGDEGLKLDKTKINDKIWCSECEPLIDVLRPLYNDDSEEIVRGYDGIKKK